MDVAMSAKARDHHQRLTDFMTESVIPEEQYRAMRLFGGSVEVHMRTIGAPSRVGRRQR